MTGVSAIEIATDDDTRWRAAEVFEGGAGITIGESTMLGVVVPSKAWDLLTFIPLPPRLGLIICSGVRYRTVERVATAPPEESE